MAGHKPRLRRPPLGRDRALGRAVVGDDANLPRRPPVGTRPGAGAAHSSRHGGRRGPGGAARPGTAGPRPGPRNSIRVRRGTGDRAGPRTLRARGAGRARRGGRERAGGEDEGHALAVNVARECGFYAYLDPAASAEAALAAFKAEHTTTRQGFEVYLVEAAVLVTAATGCPGWSRRSSAPTSTSPAMSGGTSREGGYLPRP